SYVNWVVMAALKDPVGRPDYALAADGAKIAPTLTSSFDSSDIALSHPPTNILDEDLWSTSCWSFPGSQAQVGIKLRARYIHPTHITIEHVPREITADIRQAPREIVVWALLDPTMNAERVDDANAMLCQSKLNTTGDSPPIRTRGIFLPLAAFEYAIEADTHVQMFPVD
ncbi:hypothetical protein C8Q76DRAFT_588799, partial [Earliella scabrosa]